MRPAGLGEGGDCTDSMVGRNRPDPLRAPLSLPMRSKRRLDSGASAVRCLLDHPDRPMDEPTPHSCREDDDARCLCSDQRPQDHRRRSDLPSLAPGKDPVRQRPGCADGPVKVTTDAGIVGYGEVDSNPMAVKGCIEGPFSHTTATGLAHVLIGEDPLRTEYLWHKMYRANIYGGRRGVAIHAMSGIDLALWDIKGKALGLPIWRLLGGGFTKSLRAYASSLFGETPAETGRRARRFADQGFTAVKFGWDPMGQDAQTDVALVREARAGLGDDLDLMIDAGLVYDAKTAIQYSARAFEPYNPFWSTRSRSCPTTTWAMPSPRRPARCGSRPARRRASGSRSFSLWMSARST